MLYNFLYRYISRYEEEIEALKSTLRANRPIPKRLDELQLAKKQEEQEYTSTGFTLPDLKDSKVVQTLRNWNGDYNAVSTIRQIRLVSAE